MKNAKSPLIGGQFIQEWDRKWVKVPGGLEHHHSHLRAKVGLYRLTLNGRIVAIGTGTDKKGGLAKRLSDFRRPSPSGRDHHAGRLIYENLDQIEVEVLITGKRHQPETGRKLKWPMILRHRPSWTAPHSLYVRKG
jgi:hypothetical protein